MKKTTLTVAMLLTKSFLFAQGNQSTISESGNFNVAHVDQADIHSSHIIQVSSATNASDGNLATVRQSSISNFNISQSEARIEQFGKSHISTVLQTGKNKLESYIGSDGTTPAANSDNETYAKQYGNDNAGKQFIRGASANQSLLSLNQGGNGNNSVQTASWAVLSKGSAVQSGNTNDVWQQIDGTNNIASTVQTGSGNYSFQWIENGGSANNVNSVLQTSNNNISRIVTTGDDNVFVLNQIGDNNKSVGISGGIYTNAEQTGDRNNAVLTQTGDNNEIWLEQKGDDNTIQGTSLAGALQLGTFNKTIFSQVADGSTIISKQIGHHNSEQVMQTGNGQSSDVRQIGNSNNTNVTQANN